MSIYPQNTKVVSRDGSATGVTTGSSYRCQQDGCTGVRVSVRWQDGKNTRPCSKAMLQTPDGALKLG